MFIWLFHRISGLALIALIGVKIVSGYALTGDVGAADMAGWHTSSIIDVAILFFFSFHALYGVRTVLIDMGVRRERALFWSFSTAALALFLGSLYFVYLT
ncbi:MAG: hypothetical protein ACE5OR_14010 [bacterium]